jgi:hypothetical protein
VSFPGGYVAAAGGWGALGPGQRLLLSRHPGPSHLAALLLQQGLPYQL